MLCTTKYEIFISQEQEIGIIVVNIVPKSPAKKKHQSKTQCDNETGDTIALLFHLIHVAVIFGLFLQSGAFSNFLLLAFALDFLSDEIFVCFQAALDVDLEFDDVVEHALELCVQLFTHGGRT